MNDIFCPLEQSFYDQPTPVLAQNLLGKVLIHKHVEGTTAGVIVETEAYLYPTDEAAHSFRGPTKRNAVMFGPGGVAYVYFTYGMHYCMNVVAGAVGEAVLIRAVEPLVGLELMQQRRHDRPVSELTNGPAKLTQAFGITREQNGWDLQTSPLSIAAGKQIPPTEIVTSPRIGITQGKEALLRFYWCNSPFVSQVVK